MTRIVLVRHGHVPGITPERFRGRMDIALSDEGLRQAETTARYIAARWLPTFVYTSPLSRCRVTGQAIAIQCGVTAAVLPELNDLDYGTWQWKTHEDAGRECPERYRLWCQTPQLVHFPEGEGLRELAARTAEALRLILERHPDETIVAVSHDSSNRVLLLQVLQLPLSAYWLLTQEPCGLSEFILEKDRRIVVRINETAHLLKL
jgi:phosphoserine phosphatase